MRKSGKRAIQGSTDMGLFKPNRDFFGLKTADILHQYSKFQIYKGVKECTLDIEELFFKLSTYCISANLNSVC